MGQTLNVTTTIGAALGDTVALTPRELIDAAHAALYHAKDCGRDGYSTVSLAGHKAAQLPLHQQGEY